MEQAAATRRWRLIARALLGLLALTRYRAAVTALLLAALVPIALSQTHPFERFDNNLTDFGAFCLFVLVADDFTDVGRDHAAGLETELQGDAAARGIDLYTSRSPGCQSQVGRWVTIYAVRTEAIDGIALVDYRLEVRYFTMLHDGRFLRSPLIWAIGSVDAQRITLPSENDLDEYVRVVFPYFLDAYVSANP